MHAEVYDNSLVSRCIMKKKETVIGVPCEILDKEVMTFTKCLIPKATICKLIFFSGYSIAYGAKGNTE